MQYVILCAGNGTRMKPLTNTISKVMIPIANRPALEWTINKLDGEIILVVNKNQKDIIEYFGREKRHADRCKIVYQEQLTDAGQRRKASKHTGVQTVKGTADAILSSEAEIEDEFVCMNGDESFDRKEIKKFSKQKTYTIAVARVDNPEKFGIWNVEKQTDAKGVNTHRLAGIEEKPKSAKKLTDAEGVKTHFANVGLYKLDRRIFEHIRKTPVNKIRKEKEITDTFNLMIKNGIEFSFFTTETWKTMSYPWHILEMNKRVLDEYGNIIGKNVDIRPGAVIEEPAALGDNSIIGPNCFIRKYSSIGKNCKVGNAVEIKNSVIMDNCHISHLSYVGDSIVGRNCNIGAGTIFANLKLNEKTIWMKVNGNKMDTGLKKLGGVLGDNVKLGVNVTIMPGKKVWNDIMIPACTTISEDVEKQPRLKNNNHNKRR